MGAVPSSLYLRHQHRARFNSNHAAALTTALPYPLPRLPAGFFKYIKWALHDFSNAPLHTNNQLLSLTDQLNLGVRSVELDTHWVSGVLGQPQPGGWVLWRACRRVGGVPLAGSPCVAEVRHPLAMVAATCAA